MKKKLFLVALAVGVVAVAAIIAEVKFDKFDFDDKVTGGR